MTKKSLPLWFIEAPVILVVSLVVVPSVVKGFEIFGLTKENSVLVSLVLQQLSFLVGTFYLKRRYPLYPDDMLVLKPDWKGFWRSLLWLPAILLISILGTSISTQLFGPLLGPERVQSLLLQEQSRVNVLFLDSWRLVLAAIVICLVGPISEELFFRGFFFSRMSATYTPKVGYLLTSFFFAIPHFYLINFIPIFLLSLIFCYIARNESLWGAVGAHVFFNTTVFINTILHVV